MAGQCMTLKYCVSIPPVSLFPRSNNQISFKPSTLSSFPLSGLNHNASSRVLLMTRPSLTPVSFQCRYTKGGDLGVWKYFVPKSKFQWFIWMLLFSGPIKDALYTISKWVAIGFVSLLHYLKSLKKVPMNIKFDRLIGVDDIILEFQDIISILHGKKGYKKLRAKLPKGVLLYGPPGTGKGTLVHAMAREAKLPFFPVYADDILKGDVRVKNLFNEARRCSPCIVYIRRVNAIAQQENCESYSALRQLHMEMENCDKDGKMVMVIASTTSPETLDPALMSSGRFYKTIHVAKPDKDCRQKMVHWLLSDYLMKEDKEEICNLVASKTSGLSWANIANITADSRASAVKRRSDHVTMDDVLRAIKNLDQYISLVKRINKNSCDS